MGLFDKFAKEKSNETIDPNNLPEHIAVIMDGNGRWAKKRGLPRNTGHSEGSKALQRIVEYAESIGIKYFTVYAFSTENWTRPKSEVDGLMSLLLDYLKNADKTLAGKNTKIVIVGDIDGLPEDVKTEARRVMKKTENNRGLQLNIALNYGGRQDIVHAAKSLAEDVAAGKINIDNINIEEFSTRLYTGDIPDPDLIIRTSGEQRLSNFLLWQSAYTEFWFIKVLWPDFKKAHLEQAIIDYQKRNRRFGGV
jgi:undecaprenyl diphosphate synthase